jgi:hypothetical protein
VDPFDHFYLLAKIHKNPWAICPIVSASGCLLEGLGKWTDRQLQLIWIDIPYIVRNFYIVTTVKNNLLYSNSLPPGTHLFTTDAILMYTNSNTMHALTVIRTLLTTPRPDFATNIISMLIICLGSLSCLWAPLPFNLETLHGSRNLVLPWGCLQPQCMPHSISQSSKCCSYPNIKSRASMADISMMLLISGSWRALLLLLLN